MNQLSHKTEGINCPKPMRFHPFTFTGKELDEETGFGYFGARYYWSEVLTGWLSVDPMADKYPNISPYHYCSWNPINILDPNGKDGVKIIDKQTHSITVSATYYVTSQPIPGKPNTSYSPSEIESMQNDINNILNSQGFTYEIDGEKYDVCFDLRFVAGGEAWRADYTAKKDPIGNFFTVHNEEFHVFNPNSQSDGTETHIGGVTENNKTIVMNAKYDNTRRRIHEIFHTLFFNNDNAEYGIGNYDPGVDMPNQNDINILLSNPQLSEKIIGVE